LNDSETQNDRCQGGAKQWRPRSGKTDARGVRWLHWPFLPFAGTLVLTATPAWSSPCQTVEDSVLFPRDPTLGDFFGQGVAVTEDLAFVAEPNDNGGQGNSIINAGAVHLFERTPAGWKWRQELLRQDIVTSMVFGNSLAARDGYVVVGAFPYGEKGAAAGVAYIFESVGGMWVEVAKLLPSQLEAFDAFGISVAVSGETILVGASGDDDLAQDRGAAYVYDRGPSGWGIVQKVIPTDPSGAVLLGAGMTCAIDGNVLAISATGQIPFFTYREVFVFERINGTWIQTALLVDPTPLSGDQFAYGLAVDGDTIAVGEPAYFASSGSRPGSVFIFERSGPAPGGWSLKQEIMGGAATTNDNFGGSVDLEGDTLVVGASSGKQGANYTGRAYVFERKNGVWVEKDRLVPSKMADFLGFGDSVAVCKSQILVGAFADDPYDTGIATGSAYVFDRPLGSSFCVGDVNSTGIPATITATGSLAARAGDLELFAQDLPSGEFGLFMVARDAAAIPMAAGSQNNLCLGGQVGYFRDSLGSTKKKGRLRYRVDTGSLPLATRPSILAGSTWYFQGWYRDHLSVDRSKFTPALRITFE